MMQKIIKMKFLLLSSFAMVYANQSPYEDNNIGGYDTLTKVSLKDVDPEAVCNDGSEAAYYFKKSPTGSDRWLVMLMGTEGC